MFFTTGLAGWNGQALAADGDDRGRFAAPAASESAVLPPWFLPGGSPQPASAAPPVSGEAAPLFADGDFLDQLIIRDAQGDGPEIPPQTLNADQSLTLWAAGYYSGTFRGNQTVTWSVTGGIGIASPTSGLSTTFYANAVGIGTVVATRVTTYTITGTTGTITVTAGALHHFVVDAPDSGTAGVGFTTLITAQDSDDNTVTSFAQDVTLSTNGSDIQPGTAPLSGGVWSGAITLTVAGSRVVTATYNSATGADSLTINPNTATQLVYTSAPGSATAGVESGAFTVQRRDAYSNPVTSGTTTVNLSTSSTGANAEFRDTPSGSAVSSVTINDGSSTADFYYYDELAGSHTITASASGLSDAVTPFTVNPASATTFVFSAVADQTAGQPGTIATLTAQDPYGNTDTNYTGDHTLNWSGLGTAPGGQQPVYPNPVNFAGGVASGLSFTPYRAETGVSLTASESGGPSGSSNAFTVTTASLDHVVVTPASVTLDPGGTQQFSAQGYDAYDNTISGLSYAWAVVNGGGSISAGGLFTAATADAVYADTVQATATPGGVIGTATVTVNNLPPTAEITSGPHSGNEGSSISFSGSGSDPNGDPLTYEWDFDYDGVTFNVSSTLQNPGYAYPDNGTYWAALRVEDDDDAVSAVVTTTVTVSNVAPDVTAATNQNVNEGQLLSLQVATFTDAGSADTHTAEIDWGDGTVDGGAVGVGTVSGSHTYADNGAYTVVITVTDDDGGVDSDSFLATVSNVSPVVTAAANQAADEGDTLDLQVATFTDAGSDDTHTAQIDWGDGTVDGGTVGIGTVNGSHTYADNGAYTVVITVTDDDGGVGSDSFVATVSNVAPTAHASNDSPVDEGSSVTVTAWQTDPGADTFTYDFDWHDDGIYEITDSVATTATHIYYDSGPHTVRVRVNDDDGGAGVTTTPVTVNNVPPTAIISSPPTQTAGLNVTFDASGSYDPGQDITGYDWDLDNDGQYDDASGVTTTISWTVAAVYTVGLRVTDLDSASGTDQVTITVEPGPLDHFIVSVPTSSTAGVGFTTVITAEDEYGNVITDWSQTVTLTTNGGAISPPEALGGDFAAGVWSEAVSLTTAGDGRLVRASYDGHTGEDTLHIEPAAATDFGFSAIGQQTAGSTHQITTLTAYDPYGNVDTNYDGNHTLAWSGLGSIGSHNPIYPANPVNFLDGVASNLSFTPYRAETGVSLTASETNGPQGTSNAFTVVHASPTTFVFANVSDQTAGTAGAIATLTAEDNYGNTTTGYSGGKSLNWSGLSSIGGHTPDYPLNPVNFAGGVASNLSFTPYRAESNVALTAEDTSGSPSGSSGTFNVAPALASVFDFSTIGTQQAGAQGTLSTLSARDAYGNVDTNYGGTHVLDWSGLTPSPNGDAPAYPPASTTFVGGVASNMLFTAYNAETNVTLSASESGGPAGNSNSFTVTHGLPSTFVFSTIPDQVAGSSDIFTLTTEDNWGNTATGYTGAHTLAWGGLGDSPNSDPPDYPPDQVSFSSGIASSLVFTPYLAEADVQITAAEGASVYGESNPFTVSVGSQVGEIVIESDPNGAGSEVTTHDMVVYETLTVYAASYDAWGNYIADQTASWGGTAEALGSLIPPNGSSTTFTPVISGTGIITAHYSAVFTDATGLITVRAPVLEVALSDSIEPVEAGETLTYTIRYSNTGNAAATSAVLTLTLDGDVDYVSASPSPDPGSGQVRTWTLNTVGTDTFAQVFVTVAVVSPLDNGTVLESMASLDSSQTDVVTDSEMTTVHSQPVLHMSKSDMPDPVQAGGSIVYTIEFSNTGNMNATGVVITDVIPANTAFESASHGGSYDAGQGVVTWDVGTVAPSQTPYRTLAVGVDSPLPSGTVITNSGYQLDSAQTMPLTGADVTTVVLSPTLTVSQTGSPDPVEAGAVVTFTIAYSNTGDGLATQVVITDVVPQYTGFAWASDGGYLFNGQVIWNIGTLPGHQGGIRTVAFAVTSPLTDSTPILNQVSIDSDEVEAATYLDLVYVHSEPVLHIAKTAASDPVQAGSQLVYTIVYTNSGNANATGVVITDALPAHTAFAAASNGGTYAGGVVTWDLGFLAGEGGSDSVILAVAVTSPLTNYTTLENAAFITCTEGSHDQASVQTTVASLPQLHVDVADSPDPVKGDRTLVYNVSYSNTGNANATAVRLEVDYDARLTFVAADPVPSSGDNIWNLPPLPGEGGAGTVVITLTTAALAPEAVLHSTFRLRSAEAGWVSHIEATEVQAVDLQLSVNHGCTDDAPYPGERITYTLHYANAGDIPATGVELTAQCPGGTIYAGQGWVASGGGAYYYSLNTVNAGASGSVQFIIQVNSTGDGRLPPGLTSLEPSFSIDDDGQNGPELYSTDNEATDLVGIPDLVVDEIRVTPGLPTPNRPVTFTVVLRNQGTGMAWNPNNHGGFFVDLFIDPDPEPQSYPWNVYGEIYTITPPLGAGQTREIVFVHQAGLYDQAHTVWAKVDNWWDPSLALWQQNSLVPESNEENNVRWIPVTMDEPDTYTIFLPVVLRNH